MSPAQLLWKGMLEGPYGGKLAAMVVWGSSLAGTKPDSDLDVLAVFEKAPPCYSAAFGKLDMALRSMDDVRQAMLRLEPSMVQPIMTGRSIWGKDVFDGLRTELRNTVPTAKHASWLASQALSMANWVQHFKERTPSDTQAVYVMLGFAVSFMATARLYASGIGRIVLLDDLFEMMPAKEKDVLLEARRLKRRAKDGKAGRALLKTWKRSMLGNVPCMPLR